MIADTSIAEKVDRALLNDDMLRNTDYSEIDVAVSDGIVYLNGHVISTTNQRKAEAAARAIPGVREVKSGLVPDDKIAKEVVLALATVEHDYGEKFYTGMRNGVVALGGEVFSAVTRTLAEKRIAQIPDVRGVVNSVFAPGVDLEAEDQRFLQPAIGELIYFSDNLVVKVHSVIINPDNRRVVAMVVRGRFSNSLQDSSFPTYDQGQLPETLVVIPISAIRYLTKSSGFLTVDSVEAIRGHDFDPSRFIAPKEGWTPPYPYHRSEVFFPVGSTGEMEQKERVSSLSMG